MGVPGLWPFIRTRFGRNAVRFFRAGTKRFQFNYVYLDANGLLHGAAQRVFNYGDGKRKIDPYLKLSFKEKLTKVFEMFFDNILDVTAMVVPTTVLYIAIDGPAPRAKQNQQRERRFIAAETRQAEENAGGRERFDVSCITPGTVFMHELSKFMYWKIRSYMQTRGPWRNVDVVYSPPTVPGEGEHVIMDYIRALPESERQRASHCMFGPDGDLFMLTLAAHVKNMNLFREDQFNPGMVNLVNMSNVQRGLARELEQFRAVNAGIRTEDDVSNDFIFMGFFVGNDFLPKIKMFYKLDQGLQKMFDTYADTSDSGFTNHLTKNAEVMIDGFRRFVFHLSKDEELYLAEQATITSPRFEDKTLLKHATVTMARAGAGAQPQRVVTAIDMQGYRQSYYQKAGIGGGGNADPEFEAGIRTMCQEYLRNLIWVYRYYVDELPSWEEAYRWHYAPLLSDFAMYLDTLKQADIPGILSFEKSRPALPFEQLLSVLPPASNGLLPEQLRPLMTNSESPLVKAGYYPTSFDVDYEGKRQEYQGVPILPFVDYSVISKAYLQQAKRTHLPAYHRNERGKVYVFRWKASGFSAHFSSAYGDITNCKVKVSELK